MKTIIAILTILAFAFGAYFYLDDRYARCEDVKKVEKRLDYKIVSDQLQAIQQRIWQIQDRFQNKKMDATIKEEVRELEVKKEQLNDKMKVMEQAQ
jgi:predicted phage-related endonuclease